MLMAEAGSLEKDVYFSTVPSQKSTLSALATITEQLLWLGGPGGLCSAHPAAASCQPENLRPKFTPQCAKTGGRHAQRPTAPTCSHPVKIGPNYGVFNRRWWRRWTKGVDFFFLLNLHAAGCMRPICLRNNRRRDVRDLARRALAAELH